MSVAVVAIYFGGALCIRLFKLWFSAKQHYRDYIML